MTNSSTNVYFYPTHFSVTVLSYLFLTRFLFLFDFLFWQEHLSGLEAEKEELGQQIDHLLLENRGLLQVKMSLGLEVTTYRYAGCTAGAVRLRTCTVYPSKAQNQQAV